MRIHLRLILTLAICLTLAGCGGGGGSAVVPVDPNLPATKLRIYQPGDSWAYTVTGDHTDSSGTKTLSGTNTTTISNVALNGHSFVAQDEVLACTYTDNTPLSSEDIVFGTQNSSGNFVEDLDEDGETGNVRGLTTVETVTPGTWSPTLVYNVTLNYTHGPADNISLRVIGNESLTTPAGTFKTWKTQVNVTSLAYTQSVTSWWAPELGSYVKAMTTTTNSAETYHFNETLQSTTVRLPTP